MEYKLNQRESECNDVLPVEIENFGKKSVCHNTDIYGCKRSEQE